MKIKRRYFENVRRSEADRIVLETFLQAFGGYQSFFVYNSFGSEADTHALISALLAMGKRVYLPRVEGQSLVAVPCGETKKGAFGVEEPIGQAYCGDVDVAVVPLLAVNERGYRIGYGGGFYDRYLKGARAVKVGLGYTFQIEEFAEDAWDERLDMFLCERGIYYFADSDQDKP